MPHLHGDEATDASPDVSPCSKGTDTDRDNEPVCKVAASAANKLLSLAAMAEQHAAASSSTDVSAEPELDKTSSKPETPRQSQSSPPPPAPSSEHKQQEVPPVTPGHHWGVVGHPPRYPGPGFFRHQHQPGMHPVYPPGHPGAGSPIPRELSPRFVPRGGPPRGGFPMWAGPPRPPYHPHAQGLVSPAHLPPHFRRAVPPHFMMRQPSSSSIDEDGGVVSPSPGGQKRPSPSHPPKSILKKARTESPSVAEANDSPQAKSEETTEQVAKSKPQTTLDTLADSAVAISEAIERNSPVNAAAASAAATTETPAEKTTIDSVVVEKASFSSEDASSTKKRIISPASSNEYPKSEYDDEMSFGVDGSSFSPDQRGRMIHSENMGSPHRPFHHSPGAPFHMGRIPSPMHPMHHAGGPYMAYPPHHPGMRPFAVPMPAGAHGGPGGPSMYPPRNMSARGRAGFAAMPPFYSRTRMESSPSPSPSSFSPEQQQRQKRAFENVQKPASPPIPSTSRSSRKSPPLDPTADVPGSSGTRCIPLNPPIPSKYWSEADINKEVILPDFHRLVNFPDLLVKGRNSGGAEGDASCTNGKKRCVMCGQLRVSATFVRAKKAQADTPVSDEANSAAGTGGAVGNSGSEAGSNHIIPRQNKGVCTACDITVWVALELDGMEIKWCKGCKNFRPWSHFGDKSLATKCLRCRDRQKEKYAMQKNANRRRNSGGSLDGGVEEEKKAADANDMHHHCSLAVVAANGLRNLMNAR